MGTVISIVCVVGLLACIGYLGYGVIHDIVENRKKKNKKGGKDTE